VFPVRYELNSYILFRRNSVLKGTKGELNSSEALRNRHPTAEFKWQQRMTRALPLHADSCTTGRGITPCYGAITVFIKIFSLCTILSHLKPHTPSRTLPPSEICGAINMYGGMEVQLHHF
jgi:hypothetical protein